MEAELKDIQSQSLEPSLIQNLIGSVGDAIEKAAEIRDQDFVNSPSIRKALVIVEDFLREKKRICYGGMAINAHLPKDKKFYDFHKVLPDYDFFTPDQEGDVTTLLRKLENYGFEDVSARLGIHEGTTKIFVNFVGVADITAIPIWLYKNIQKNALVDDGIHYVDADFLRMNMYLELSRPRGEVERWDKVYKRLLLLNSIPDIDATLKQCSKLKKKRTFVKSEMHQQCIEYLSSTGLIFAGAELEKIYSKPTTLHHTSLLKSTNPVIAFAPNPQVHVATMRQILHSTYPENTFSILHWKQVGDIMPEMYGLTYHNKVIFLVVQEKFCHAYNTIFISKDKELKIAALDTAITLFYTLSFLRGLDGLVPYSLKCFANTLVETSKRTRDKNNSGKFPLFVVSCQGHQPSKPSLLREKAKRIQRLKTKKNKSARKGHSLRRKYTSKKIHN